MMNYLKQFLTLFTLLFLLIGCNNGSNTENNENEVQAPPVLGSPPPTGHPTQVKNILFAHGYSDDSSAWDTYTDYIEDDKNDLTRWTVYRTNVTENASIEQRGEELARYISELDDVEDDSLLAVGHSMGGLDLRYIVSMGHKNEDDDTNIYYKAAKKIHKIYTLATPHGGNQFSGNSVNDAVKSMGISEMRNFNEKHPYSSSVLNQRKIPLLAFRFHCSSTQYSDGDGSIEPSGSRDTDGTVAVYRQILFGAPFTQTIFKGRHATGAANSCWGKTTMEVSSLADTILRGILENKGYYTDVKDIVMYEDRECDISGKEIGVFSSRYETKKFDCKISSRCINDEISSIKVYPNIHKDRTILLYDDHSRSKKDDWVRIHIGDVTLEKAECIWSLEQDDYNDIDENITVTYHEEGGLDGKVSAIKIAKSTQVKDPYDIVFYENGDCSGSIVSAYRSSKNSDDTCGYTGEHCTNDEARSVLLYPNVKKGTTIELYNNDNKSKAYGWTKITKTGNAYINPHCVKGFNYNITKQNKVEMDYHKHTNTCWTGCDVTGKVSRIIVEKP